jgi:hypothetical protein
MGGEFSAGALIAISPAMSLARHTSILLVFLFS